MLEVHFRVLPEVLLDGFPGSGWGLIADLPKRNKKSENGIISYNFRLKYIVQNVILSRTVFLFCF